MLLPSLPPYGAPSPPAPEQAAAAIHGVAYSDHPGWSGCGNAQHRPPGDGRVSDSSWTRPDPPTICTATPSGTRTSMEPQVSRRRSICGRPSWQR